MSRAKTLSAAIKLLSPTEGKKIVGQLWKMGYDLSVTPREKDESYEMMCSLAKGDSIIVNLKSEWDIGKAYKELDAAINKIWDKEDRWE